MDMCGVCIYIRILKYIKSHLVLLVLEKKTPMRDTLYKIQLRMRNMSLINYQKKKSFRQRTNIEFCLDFIYV